MIQGGGLAILLTAASCMFKPVGITGFSRMMDDFTLYLPGRTGHLTGYQA